MRTKAGSLWTRIWQRLSDRTRAPRKWWNPIVVYRRLPRDVFTEAYKQYAETTNRTMLVLLTVGAFCLLTVISTSDKALLAAEGTVKVPFAEASISFVGFVIVAPLLLTVVSVYLHIFYGYWLDVEHERLEYNRILPEVDKKPVEPVPMLFALGDPVSRGLTTFIFYGLAPGVLAVIAWKGAADPDLGLPLVLGFGVVAAALIFLRFRRSSEARCRWLLARWLLLVSVSVSLVYSLSAFEGFRRPLNLFRADLASVYLSGQDLRGAILTQAKLSGNDLRGANLQRATLFMANLQGVILQYANLQEAYLVGANLQEADFFEANLQRANLQGANLQGATLIGTNLQGATLVGTNLQGADLNGANLQGVNLLLANLQGANLQRADLRDVTNLTREQVASARIEADTKLPDYLKPLPPAKP